MNNKVLETIEKYNMLSITITESEAMRHIEMRKYHENSVKGSV